MSYVFDAKSYDGVLFRRCGRSGILFPPVSLSRKYLLTSVDKSRGRMDSSTSDFYSHWPTMDLRLEETMGALDAAKKYSVLNADDVRAAFAKEIQAENLVQIVRGPAPH